MMPPPRPPPPTPDIVLPADVAQRATGSHWSTRLQQAYVGLSKARGQLLAFGDYNADNFVDIYLAAPPPEHVHDEHAHDEHAHGHATPPNDLPRRQLQVWLWRGDAHTGHFALSPSTKWEVPGLLGIIPGDFNGDGELDAIAATSHPRCAEYGAVSLQLCNRTDGCTAEPSEQRLPSGAASQPLALDFTGNMHADLLAAYRDFESASPLPPHRRPSSGPSTASR